MYCVYCHYLLAPLLLPHGDAAVPRVHPSQAPTSPTTPSPVLLCPSEHEFVDPHTPTVKHIVGQAVYQLAVMYGLIFYAPALLGIPGGWVLLPGPPQLPWHLMVRGAVMARPCTSCWRSCMASFSMRPPCWASQVCCPTHCVQRGLC